MEAQPIGDRTGSERFPGLALSRDIAMEPGEKVEAEINSFISRRHEQRVKSEGERAVEESWRQSERREEAKRAEEERVGRIFWHRHLERVFAARSLEHRLAGDELEGIA